MIVEKIICDNCGNETQQKEVLVKFEVSPVEGRPKNLVPFNFCKACGEILFNQVMKKKDECISNKAHGK